MLLKDFLTGYY